MRSVWNCENARSTVRVASAAAWPFDLQSDGEDEGEEDGDALGDAEAEPVGDAVGDAEGDALAEADAVGLADALADGLGLTSVIVMVVTPFSTVAVTSAPVVPMRKTEAMTPDLAWKNSVSRRSSIAGCLLSGYTNERQAKTVRPRRCYGLAT
jgi:hypothetical protein